MGKTFSAKKCTALLLATLSLLTSSCAASGTAEQTSRTDDTSQTEQEITAQTETEPETADLPEADYEGGEFSFLLRGEGSGEWRAREIIADEQTGDTLNDAIYERNLKINETYNIVIKGIESDSSLPSLISKSVQAGDNSYDAAFVSAPDLTSAAMGGVLYNLYELPYLDFTKSWWDSYASETLSVGGRLFFTYGDMNICDKDLTWLVMFNKKIAEDNGISDLYASVTDGKWTIDSYSELVRGIRTDLNGDGLFDKNDLWGMVTPYDRTALAFLYSCGVECIVKNNDDEPQYNMDTPKLYEVYEKTMDMYFNGDCSLDVMKVSGNWRTTETMFSENKILFYIECMQNVERMRAMQEDFGILPMPKYSEDQENYINMVCDFATALCVPANAADPERTSIIIEAMTSLSQSTVLPAYYDVSLKTKYARDEDSAAMIDLIFSHRYFDLAYIYQWGGSISAIMSLALKGDTDVASKLESLKEKTTLEITKTIEAYKAIA